LAVGNSVFITDPDVHGLQQDVSIVGHAEHLGVEDDHTHGDQPEHAQQVDPVKPADAGVPDRIGFEVGLGGAPVIRAYCEYGGEFLIIIIIVIMLSFFHFRPGRRELFLLFPDLGP